MNPVRANPAAFSDYNDRQTTLSNGAPEADMVNHSTEALEIMVNGEPRTVPPGLNLLDLLRFLEVAPERVAIELNREIVRQPAWESTRIEAGAQLEIVQFVGGG